MRAPAPSFLQRCLGLPWPLRLALPLAWMAVLWTWSSQSRPVVVPDWVPEAVPNAGHVAAWALLGAGWYLALAGRMRRPLLPAFLLAAAYGVVDELHQSFVPGRSCSVFDAGSDALGAALACCWLHGQLAGDRRSRKALPWLGLAVIVSVAAATWLPGWP